MDDHLWAQVTLKQIDSGLRKLISNHGDVTGRVKLYRGIRGVEFDQYFERAMKDSNGIPPATIELGVLSVSRDFETAVRASHHLVANSLGRHMLSKPHTTKLLSFAGKPDQPFRPRTFVLSCILF